MAIFGAQLALSMMMASIISKTAAYFSLGRWLLCNTGLIRYLHPTDEELRELAGISRDITSKGKGKGKHNKDLKNPDVFHVPRDLDIRLDSIKVSAIEVTHLRFYADYRWVVDYTVYTTIIYVLTEIYCELFNARSETNLSVFWCLVALGLCVRVLFATTAIYFQGDEVIGERAMCLVMGLAYLLGAMIVLIVDEDSLEVGIDPAYKSFHDNANEFLQKQGTESVGPASKLIIKFFIAASCGISGALFIFPGIRMSRMFKDSLRYSEGKPALQFLYSLSFGLPVILLVLWIRPLGRHVFTEVKLTTTGEPLMSDAAFDSMRIILIVLLVVSRICLMPFFIQSFLNLAQHRVLDQRKLSGRVLNTDLQKQVGAIYYYLCIVALQYITPCLVCLHCCFLYKTLGGGSWTGDWSLRSPTEEMVTPRPAAVPLNNTNILPDSDAIKPAAEHFTLALASLKLVFNETVFKGIFGFATWWCLVLLATSSIIGTIYTNYLSRA